VSVPVVAWLVIGWTLTASGTRGQTPKGVAPKLADFRLDFAIPDAPAFTMLTVAPSNVLRPAEVRELGAAVSNFIGSGAAITIPKAFAVEFAPGLLIGGPTLTVPTYAAHPFLYRLGVSAATGRGAGDRAPTVIAIGVRTVLLDAGDLRTHAAYRVRATAIADSVNSVFLQARKRLGPMGGRAIQRSDLNPAEKARVDSLNASLKAGWADWEDEHWNSRTLQLAIAGRASAADSFGNGLAADKYSAWASYGDGVGTWGQVLIGVNAGSERDSVTHRFRSNASVSNRIYIGSNHYKLFVEGQGTFRHSRAARWLLSSGGETKLAFGAWITFAGGLDYDRQSRTTALKTNFAFKWGLPRR